MTLRPMDTENALSPCCKIFPHWKSRGFLLPGSFIKGTVQTVIADNLGTHGFAGFVESFFTEYVCRFCTSGEFQTFFQHKTWVQVHLWVQMISLSELRDAWTVCQVGSRHWKSLLWCKKTVCFFCKSFPFLRLRRYPLDIAHDLCEAITSRADTLSTFVNF